MPNRKLLINIGMALALGSTSFSAQAQATGGSGAALQLKDAVALALGHSPERRLGQLGAEAARAEQGAARSSLLPQIGFSESATRGDDPVYVFGTLLHQQQFAQADFALNSLNRPQPLGDFTTKFAGSWTAFDSWQSEMRAHGAGLMAKSAEATASRSDQTVIHDVVEQYEGVLLAARQAEVAAHEVETAKSLANDGDARVTAGMAVESDRLSAAANLAQRQEEQIAAQGGLAVAWAELVRAMGVIVEQPQQMPKSNEASVFALPALADAVAAAQKVVPTGRAWQWSRRQAIRWSTRRWRRWGRQ